MQGEMPFYEREEDALKACVQALGGAKVVGHKLWGGDKSVEDAQKSLLDCLNSDRPEKLSLRQITTLFRMAKQVGFDAGYNWWSNECEYESKPINTAAQIDRVVSVIEESTKSLNAAINTLARLQAGK